MVVIPDKNTIYCDVDDTLVMWHCWQGREDEILIFDEPRFKVINVIPHYRHVDILKKYKTMNKYNIVVWSQGGSAWAAAVVKKLGLEECVDVVLNKPWRYYDDLHCSDFMPPRSYEKDR